MIFIQKHQDRGSTGEILESQGQQRTSVPFTQSTVQPLCAKLVGMIHDLPLVSEDPTIICQIDFANAF
jgi:hypothetical protein